MLKVFRNSRMDNFSKIEVGYPKYIGRLYFTLLY